MRVQCPIGGCDTSDVYFDTNQITFHFMEHHGTVSVEMTTHKMIPYIVYDPEIARKDSKVVKVPFLIEYDRARFFLVITCDNGHYYFWLYQIEDWPNKRRFFHTDLTLLPTYPTAVELESNPKNVIFPITTPVDEILRKESSLLHSISDRDLKMNYTACNIYQLRILLKEIGHKLDTTGLHSTVVIKPNIPEILTGGNAIERGIANVPENLSSAENVQPVGQKPRASSEFETMTSQFPDLTLQDHQGRHMYSERQERQILKSVKKQELIKWLLKVPDPVPGVDQGFPEDECEISESHHIKWGFDNDPDVLAFMCTSGTHS